MTDQAKDKIAAAVSTPIRDLRDEVWVRVYAGAFNSLLHTSVLTFDLVGVLLELRAVERLVVDEDLAEELAEVADRAGHRADRAVEHMPIPAHRRAEVGL